MRTIIKFFMDNTTLVNVLLIGILGWGGLCLSKIPREGLPDVSVNKVIITTLYPGASASDVELKITAKIEDKIKGVAGIDRYTSESNEGFSVITVETDENATPAEFRKIYQDINDKVGEVNDFPNDMYQLPTLSTFTSADMPVMEVAIKGPQEKLRIYVRDLEDAIRQIDGIYNIDEVGFPDDEVYILLDPEKAIDKLIDFNMVANAISAQNVDGTGGILESAQGEKKVVTMNKYKNVDEILDTNIRVSSDGTGIKLRDIATIRYGVEDLKLEVRNNGSTGVYMLIKKKQGEDVIRMNAKIRQVLDETPRPEGVELKIINDMSDSTSARIGLVASNAIVGGILVFIALFFILDAGTAFWTAAGIPFDLMGAFIVAYYLGYSLNIITLAGFIMVIGMLVDNAIVVAEEVTTNRENGMGPVEAAIEGVNRVWKPVFASTATTVIAFMPLMTLNGISGSFLKSMPVVVIVTLIYSMVEAYFLLPTHLSWLKINPKKMHKNKAKENKVTIMKRVEQWWSKIMVPVLKFRYVVVALFVFLLLRSFTLFDKGLRMIPFPNDDSQEFYLTITKPIGTLYKDLEKDVIKVEKIIEEVTGDTLIGYTSRLGTDSSDVGTDRGSQNNLAMVYVYLNEASKREKTALEISEEVRAKLQEANLKDFTFTAQVAEEGPSQGRDVEVDVMFREEAQGLPVVERLKKFLAEQKGVYDVEDDRIPGKEEYNLKIDYDALNSAGLTANDVLSTIKAAFDGRVVSSKTDLYGTVDYRLKMKDEARKDINFLKKLPMINSKGQLIRINDLVHITKQPSLGVVKHVNGQRSVTVKASVNTALTTPQAVADKINNDFQSDDGVLLALEGGAKENAKIFLDLFSAFAVAIVVMYLAICLIFNSYVQPLVVMSCIPFTIIGVLYSLYFHNTVMSMMVTLGVIGLMGVVVNGSIEMLYKMIDLNKDTGNKYFSKEIIIEGTASRIRPIFLSNATTVAGLLPTAYGLGGYDTFISPQSLATGYGILFGTLIVLLLVPCVLEIAQDIGKILGHCLDFIKAQINNVLDSILPNREA